MGLLRSNLQMPLHLIKAPLTTDSDKSTSSSSPSSSSSVHDVVAVPARQHNNHQMKTDTLQKRFLTTTAHDTADKALAATTEESESTTCADISEYLNKKSIFFNVGWTQFSLPNVCPTSNGQFSMDMKNGAFHCLKCHRHGDFDTFRRLNKRGAFDGQSW